MNKLKNKTRIHEADIKNSIWTAKVPDVDLIIRTGVKGDPHLSGNVLLWQTGYSQLYFSELFWPDFKVDEFKKSIVDYGKRERREGR
jgi:undecaprenyl diphosphate synthase